MNVNLGIDLNPIDYIFGSEAGAVAASANAWNTSAGITQDQASAFLDAYHAAVISGAIKPPAPTDGQGGAWDTTTYNWLSSIAPTLAVSMDQVMALMCGLWASAKAGKVSAGTWNPQPNVFESVSKAVTSVTTGVTKSADSKLNIVIFGALGLGALYLFLNKRK